MSEEEKKEVLDQEKDLNADELDEVAGGKWCSCVWGGGGTGNDGSGEKTCACVMGGGGEYSDVSREIDGKKTRCACVGFGYGDGEGGL